MKKSDVVVIGGSAAGLTAAIAARRNYPQASITLIRRERRVPVPCGIPYVFGTLKNLEENLMPDSFLEQNVIDLLVSEAERIDTNSQIVTTYDGPIGYDRLVVATGSRPVAPSLPGSDLEGVFLIHKDQERLRKVKERSEKARYVVVIGGGFIGVEVGDELAKKDGKHVSIVEILPHCLMASYDKEFCVEMEDTLKKRGIHIFTSTKVESLRGNGAVQAVRLSDGGEIEADMVILAMGAQANVDLARAAGLTIGPMGGICVDTAMRTSDSAVFACGDCAEKVSYWGAGPCSLKLASIATREARVAGANLFEVRRRANGVIGAWSTAIGAVALGAAGLTEAGVARLGCGVVTGRFEGIDRHPAAMPGATPLKIKLVFHADTSALLGGHARGGAAVGELVNTIAMLARNRMTAEEIASLPLGTHPALTASPIVHPLINAAEMACMAFRRRRERTASR